MNNTQDKLHNQYNVAAYISRVKQKEWLEKAKQHIPIFAADYLFYKNPSVLTDMLAFDEVEGFKYDPEILYSGIELLFKIFGPSMFYISLYSHHLSMRAPFITGLPTLRFNNNKKIAF